jgi:hypothetical protein
MILLISHTLEDFRLINFANTNAHWSLKKKMQTKLHYLWYYPNRMALKLIELPVVAKIIRISPRPQDFDNYVYNCKGVRDFIADKLIPDKAPGQADSSPLIQWQYSQHKGDLKEYSLTIQIWKKSD